MPEYRGGRSIKLAYVTAGFSKIATVVVQVLALPLAARDLGSDRFGALMVLTVLAAFWSQVAQGISPAASIMIARARGADKDVRETFWAFVLLSLLLGLGIGAFSLAADFLLPVTLFLGNGALAFAKEAREGLIAVSAYNVLYCFFSWSDGGGAGFLRNHVTNLFSMVCSVFTSVGVVIVAFAHGNLWVYFAVIFVSRPIFFGLNLAWLYWTYRDLLGRPIFRWLLVRTAFDRAASLTLGLCGVNLQLQGSVYVVAHVVGLGSSALLGSVIRIFTLVCNTILSIVTPIIPTINIALAKNDFPWVRKSALTIVTIGVVSGSGLFLALSLFGGTIMRLWLGIQVPADRLMFASLGAYGFAYIMTTLLYLLLSTLHDTRMASVVLLVCAIVSTAVGLPLLFRFGIAGLMSAHWIALLVAAIIPFTRRIFALIASHRPVAAAVSGHCDD